MRKHAQALKSSENGCVWGYYPLLKHHQMFASSTGNSVFWAPPPLPETSMQKEICPWEVVCLKVIFHGGEEKRKALTKYFWPAALCRYRLQWLAAAESCQKQSSRGRLQRWRVIGNVHCLQTAFPCLATPVAGATLANEPLGWRSMNMGPTCPADPMMTDPTSCVLQLLCEKNKSACAKAGTSMCTNTWACTRILQTPASPTRPRGLSMALVQGGGLLTVSKGPRGCVGSCHPSRNAWETHSYPRFCIAEPQHRAESFQTHLWEILSPLTPKAFAGL